MSARAEERPEVLVADDDGVHRRMVEARLAQRGYTTHGVSNGEDALARLLDPAGPRLAILDWMMPGLDGLGVIQRVRAATGHGPYRYLILVTAKDAAEDVVFGLDAGADDYLRKPAALSELIARIRCGERIVKLEEDLRHAREALAREATEDVLTGLLNRRGVTALLEHHAAGSARGGTPFSLLMVDLDHFKRVNDTHGHAGGDAVLAEAARRMRGALRGEDRVARWGGEEFLVLLPRAGPTGALVAAERLRMAIRKRPFVVARGAEVPVTASFGVATVEPALACDLESAVECADLALYTAKRTGRDRTVQAVACLPGAVVPFGVGLGREGSEPLPQGGHGPVSSVARRGTR